MSTVTWVEKKGDKAAILVMSDDTRVWTPDKALADTLVGKSIPEDWTIKQGDLGPQAFAPRPKTGGFGGAAAYKNTKEGMLLEQDSIHRSVALKLAVKQHGENGPEHEAYADGVTQLFNFYLKLLSSGAVTDALPSRAPESSVVPPPGDGGEVEGVGVGGLGEELPTPVDPRTCKHEATSPLAPSGRALKEGRVRCLDCNLVIEEAKV
jgi:hypothetical protein